MIQNHTETTIHAPQTKKERELYDQEWEAWCRRTRCPGCADNGVQVTMGRWEPDAVRCPVCQGAPHPADAPGAHVDAMGRHGSNWRCEPCGGSGEVTGHDTGHPFDGHSERCPDCKGRGIHVMGGNGLELYTDTDGLIQACRAAADELEAAQRHDGHAPSTEKVLRRLYEVVQAR